MSFQLSLSEAAMQYGGTLAAPDCHFSAVSIDSRSINKGELFVALRGERFDGHQFIEKVKNIACGLVVETFTRNINLPQWVVPNTTTALGQLASIRRKHFQGPVVAITGSSGKTTVKEMTTAILSQVGAVAATQGNFNNQIGVPLTLLGLNQSHQFAVIEMGARAEGDIAYLCAISSPNVALVNNVLPAHIAGFGSVDNIARAKGEIYESLSSSGTAVINIDQVYRNDWMSSCGTKNVLTFSANSPDADLTASDILRDDNGQYHFLMKTPAATVQISLPIQGKHNVANALAAAACAYAVGAQAEQIAAGLNTMKSISGRMQRLAGISGSSVIDDSYNANPGSMKAAINALADLSERKILVIGDMAELGADSAVIHGEIGRYARQAGIDEVFAVGPLSYETVQEFGHGAHHFETKQQLVEALRKVLNMDSVALVKGSRSAGMEDVVKSLVLSGEF